MARTKNVCDKEQGTLLDTSASNEVKTRLYAMLDYDFKRLPHRVASTLRSDLAKMVWYDEGGSDEACFYYGLGNGRDIASKGREEFLDIEHRLPNPIYRGDLLFYPVMKEISYGGTKLAALQLDPGYIEFFIDILVGSIGLYRRRDMVEVWRRFGRIVQKIESIETFYGVGKPVAGVYETVMDMMSLDPSLTPKRVASGVAINDVLYGGLGEEPLTDDIIPKHIIDARNPDLRKGKRFFDLVCPDEESQHNLMLATVYPYFKRNNEKFFILKGSGGNGKSTYMEHFGKLIGEKFGTVDLAGLAANGFERTNAIGRMQGRLVLQANETDMTEPKFVAELKKIATGDYFIGRAIGSNSFEFKSEAVLFMDTNTVVNVDSTPAMQRRLVGIQFTDRKLSWDDLDPYKDWINTADGACSVFLSAYYYLQEECEGRFSWYDVDVNEDEAFSQQAERFIDNLMLVACERGIDKAWLFPSGLDGLNNWEKKRLFDHYGLKSEPRRVNGNAKNQRLILVKDKELFARRMRKEGFGDEQADTRTGAA